MPRVKLFDEKKALEDAMDLFWTKGYSATSIQDIVDHLGINRASLYATFGGKETLFKSALDLYRDKNTKAIKEFLNSQDNVKTGLLKLFTLSIDESVADKDRKGCFVVNSTTELIPGNPKIRKLLESNKRYFEDLFYEYLKNGEAKGQIPAGKDLIGLASLLFTIYNGLKVTSKIDPKRDRLIQSIELTLSLLD